MARLGNGSVQYKFSAAVICSGIVSLSTAVAAAVGLIKEETFLLLFFSFFLGPARWPYCHRLFLPLVTNYHQCVLRVRDKIFFLLLMGAHCTRLIITRLGALLSPPSYVLYLSQSLGLCRANRQPESWRLYFPMAVSF